MPLRRLVAGERPSAERIFFTSLWFRGHNNPRYAELLPRLHRLDGYLFVASERRLVRGIQYRGYRISRHVRNPALLRLASRRYRGLFTADPEQIRWFAGPVVADIDDPYYTPEHVALLNRSNLAAYVVTAERAARRYESLGVDKPWVVVPQGVSLRSATPELVREAGRAKRGDEIVVGWMAAHLLTAGDRGAEGPLYNVDHLLELWEEVHARAPRACLWMIGGASSTLRRRLEGREDVVLFGRLPRERALATAANFDVAVYARTRDTGIQAAKIAEFIGLGVPVVSYDYEVTQNLRDSGAGILVRDPRDFAEALVSLIEDEQARRSLAAVACKAGAELDWDLLARRYEDVVLDRYLPVRP
jgi:glycosyltransferase involved in cell wall biosynthesis